MLRLNLPLFVAAFALVACASDGDSALPYIEDEATDPELAGPFWSPPAAVPVDPDSVAMMPSAEEEEAEFQRRAGTALSDEERLKVERILELGGEAPEDVTFVGRMLLRTDVYTDAEELLALPDALLDEGLVQKGRVISRIFTTTTATPGPTPQLPVLPELYARTQNGNFQFFRPYVSHIVAFTVPTNDFLLSLFTLITGNVNAAANDCLTANGNFGTLRAGTVANFNALTPNERARISRVNVIRGPLSTACPGASGTIKGCSLGVRHQNILHLDGVTRSTMVVGPRIGLLDTAVTGLNAQSRRIATHEVLHTLGLAHPSQSTADGNGDGQPDAIVVPGTSSSATVISVLQDGCSGGINCVSNDMSADDIAVVDRLYSPQPGGSCAYVDAFQTISTN